MSTKIKATSFYRILFDPRFVGRPLRYFTDSVKVFQYLI